MKTSWSSASERGRTARLDLGPDAAANAPLVELNDVSLRFVSYYDKQYSVKRAVLDMLVKRDEPAPSTDFWALSDVSLRMHKGERIGIMGHNGAGKSTLLRLMARIYPPTSGSLAIRGRVAPLIEMGAGFNPELSGRDNILLNGAMLGFTRRQMQAKVEGIFDFTGLREFAELPLKYYSSGMYLRLAFAIATEIDPDILLIDESLGAGDLAFIQKAKARIRGLLDRSNIVVIVSHDLGSLMELCTRGIWMEKGRVHADGPIRDVIHAYLVDAQERTKRMAEEAANEDPLSSLERESIEVRLNMTQA